MKKYHEIRDICFRGDYMVLTIDGVEKKYRLKDFSSLLEQATENERNAYEISPSGYGIHWPSIDEDITIDGLLGIVHYSPQTHRQETVDSRE